jgi:hypothetical protein
MLHYMFLQRLTFLKVFCLSGISQERTWILLKKLAQRVELMIKNGADFQVRDQKGHRPIEVALSNGRSFVAAAMITHMPGLAAENPGVVGDD